MKKKIEELIKTYEIKKQIYRNDNLINEINGFIEVLKSLLDDLTM